MNAVDIIIKKRDGKALSTEEIRFFIDGYTRDEIPDYQAAAWAMAVLCKGMTEKETADLTIAMAESGEKLDLDDAVDVAVDKHSTGGVGDKTTLIVQPIVTACGLAVAKMSGRGLGFSGGTIDKLESIPGIKLGLSKEEFLQQLKEHKTVLSGQSVDLAPADGKLYALRDVTGTVPAMPLIASSIMSKKIAAGTHLILLDVKVGNGAFMETLDQARTLAELMVSIGKQAGRTVKAELSDMNQPLGSAVGNILEVKEAAAFLKGEPVPSDLYDHCIESSAQLLLMGKIRPTLDECRTLAISSVKDGSAFESLKKLIGLQHGDTSYLDYPEKFPPAPVIRTIASPAKGWIKEVNARKVGETSVLLGAGREKKSDTIDHRVGILVHHKVGEYIEKGAPLFTIHAGSEQSFEQAAAALADGCVLSQEKVEPLPQFYGIVE